MWARDVSENLTPVGGDAGGILPVFDWTEHPKTIIPFPNEPTTVDILFDAKRSVVYQLRSDLDRGINSVIDVVVIPSGIVNGSIPVGGRAAGLSLTERGAPVALPCIKAIQVFPVKVENGEISVALD